MTKLNRVTGKVFGGDATATGDNPEIGQFGSALAGTYNGTTDVATIQNLPAWGQGWAGAVTPDTNFPALPEMTGFGKVLSYQNNYVLQSGVPEYDSGTIYYTNNFCRVGNILYYSLTDDNQGNNPTTDTTNWAVYDDKFLLFNATTSRILKMPSEISITGTVNTTTTSTTDITATVPAGTSVALPNGRNEDGSLKNLILTLEESLTNTWVDQSTNRILLLRNSTGDSLKPGLSVALPGNIFYVNKSENLPTTMIASDQAWCYVEAENLWYFSNSGSTTPTWTQERNIIPIAYIKMPTAGTVNYTTFYPTHMLTNNDSWWLSGIGMPSSKYEDLELGASGSTYTAPANGWFCFNKQGSSGQLGYGDIIMPKLSTPYYSFVSRLPSNGNVSFILPVMKGYSMELTYTLTSTFYWLRFIYADGVPLA